MKNSAVVTLSLVSLLTAFAGTGCASNDSVQEDDDGAIDANLVSGNGPAPLKNQRTGCDGGDFFNTTIGPFGACSEVLLDRVMVPEYTDESGHVTPAHPDTPARWEGWNLPVEMPTGWRVRDVTILTVKNLTTGDDAVKHPILCAPVTFYVGPARTFGQGIRVKEGRNKFTYTIKRLVGTAPPETLVYKFEATFKKKPR